MKLLISSVIIILILLTSVCMGSASKYNHPENQDKLNILNFVLLAIIVIPVFLYKPKLDETKYENKPNPNKIFDEEYRKQQYEDTSRKSILAYTLAALIIPVVGYLFWRKSLLLGSVTQTLIGGLLFVLGVIAISLLKVYRTYKLNTYSDNALKITLEKTGGLRPTYHPVELTPKMRFYVFIVVIIGVIIFSIIIDRYYLTPLP
jgi:hypothetical protein